MGVVGGVLGWAEAFAGEDDVYEEEFEAEVANGGE